MRLEVPSWELIEDALSASANATVKIVFLVIIGVIATANGELLVSRGGSPRESRRWLGCV